MVHEIIIMKEVFENIVKGLQAYDLEVLGEKQSDVFPGDTVVFSEENVDNQYVVCKVNMLSVSAVGLAVIGIADTRVRVDELIAFDNKIMQIYEKANENQKIIQYAELVEMLEGINMENLQIGYLWKCLDQAKIYVREIDEEHPIFGVVEDIPKADVKKVVIVKEEETNIKKNETKKYPSNISIIMSELYTSMFYKENGEGRQLYDIHISKEDALKKVPLVRRRLEYILSTNEKKVLARYYINQEWIKEGFYIPVSRRRYGNVDINRLDKIARLIVLYTVRHTEINIEIFLALIEQCVGRRVPFDARNYIY